MKSSFETLIGDKKYVVPGSIQNAELVTTNHEPWLDALYQTSFSCESGAFIDVGANLGQSLFKMLSLDNSRIYVGFEPQLEGAIFIQQFLALNHLNSHHIFPVALSNQVGTSKLYLHKVKFDRAASGVASIISGFRPQDFYSASKSISTMTGDSVLDGLELKKIAMLKIDVEGAELEVIQGFEKTLRTHLPIIHFEVLNHSLIMTGALLDDQTITFRESRAAKLEQMLRSLGYQIYQVLRRGVLQKIDKIKPLKILDQSDAHYFAIHTKDHDGFITKLKSISASLESPVKISSDKN